jgi:hypothetical protein
MHTFVAILGRSPEYRLNCTKCGSTKTEERDSSNDHSLFFPSASWRSMLAGDVVRAGRKQNT